MHERGQNRLNVYPRKKKFRCTAFFSLHFSSEKSLPYSYCVTCREMFQNLLVLLSKNMYTVCGGECLLKRNRVKSKKARSELEMVAHFFSAES